MPYKKVQFIAFNIKPGTKKVKGEEVYLGNEDASKDISKRCIIMKNAITTAQKKVKKSIKMARKASNKVNKDKVLKVFMAPEFFFRGTEGAYPIEMVSEIMQEMRKETDKPEYCDWLFVFGTAIGYQKHDETITKIVAIDKEPISGNTVIYVDHLSQSGWKDSVVKEYAKANVSGIIALGVNRFQITLDTNEKFQKGKSIKFIYGPEATETKAFKIEEGSKTDVGGKTTIIIEEPSPPIEEGWVAEVEIQASTIEKEDKPSVIKAKVNKNTALGANRFQITLDTNQVFPKGLSIKFVYGPKATVTKAFEIKASEVHLGKTRIIVENPKLNPCPTCNCPAFAPNQWKPSLCSKCLHTHLQPIEKDWIAEVEIRKLTLNTKDQFNVGKLINLERQSEKKTEVFNIALIQKGGTAPPADPSEKRELIVYKEYVSGIDYIIRPGGKFLIHGEERNVLPTSKSGRTSEVSESGLGGGSVFTIDGVRFGLEVCLDHAEGRLDDFYKTLEMAGKPKPQIHLIPSWGMDIGLGPICCVDKKGLIFNVDGSRGDSVARVNDNIYSCDEHPEQKKTAPDRCVECKNEHFPGPNDIYYCPDCYENKPGYNGFEYVQSNCIHCGKPTVLYRQLKPIGTSVPYTGNPTDVKLSGSNWFTITQSNYFQGKGKIAVYPVQSID